MHIKILTGTCVDRTDYLRGSSSKAHDAVTNMKPSPIQTISGTGMNTPCGDQVESDDVPMEDISKNLAVMIPHEDIMHCTYTVRQVFIEIYYTSYNKHVCFE